MKGTTHFKPPTKCSEGELRKFEHLVRQGFEGSDDSLPIRIHEAKQLAFYYAAENALAAIAALKAPNKLYRDDVFKKANALVDPADYILELGWVFVLPDHRGSQIAERLCQQLLKRNPNSFVFATTRPNNKSMIRILHALGFVQEGIPFPRRKEELILYLLSQPTNWVP